MEKYKATRNESEEMPKTQDEKNIENNVNTLNNAAEVAEATGNPYAVAAAKAYKGLNKITGGKSSQMLGKAMNKANKFSPGGKQIQNASNKLSESGVGDKIGKVASMKNSAKGGGSNDSVNKEKALGNKINGKSGNLSSNSLFGENGSFNIGKNIFSSWKVKLILVLAACFLFLIMLVATVIAGDDLHNLSLTNNSSMTNTGNFNSQVDSTMYDGGTSVMLVSGETLLSKLGQEKLDEINNQIMSDVLSAGSGTGAGVATAAYDFIKLLQDNGINMTYTYGGGHGTVLEGLQGSWGYDNGLDCSSFVSWALYNGGCKNYTSSAVSGTQATYGVETAASSLKAGDIIANDEHVMLVLNNTGSSVVVAHARGKDYGIVFSERTYDSLSSYSLRDMSTYYSENCR